MRHANLPYLLVSLLFTACGGKDTPGTDTGATETDGPTTKPGDDDDVIPPDQEHYGLVADGLGAALFSVWGDAADNVWTVGADDGGGPLALHYDGASWARIDTSSASGNFWWVWGEGDTLFFGATGGRVYTYTPSTGELVPHDVADPAYTFFGVWGSGPTDVWAVAGDNATGLDGVIYHYDGTAWTLEATADRGAAGAARAAFKVWGASANDVWVVGMNALLMHWDGASWSTLAEPVYQTTPLFTVHGMGSEAYAVGGFGNASIVGFDGTTWADESPPIEAVAPGLIGVYTPGSGDPVAVGHQGAVYWRTADGWQRDGRGAVTPWSYHGTWVDPSGGLWAVGGDLTNLNYGVILYAGNASVPDASGL